MSVPLGGFSYHRPATVEEAIRLRAETRGARFMAGGTDLLVQMKDGVLRPPALVSLRGIPELRGVEVGEVVRIGALTPLTDLLEHPGLRGAAPALVQALETMGSPQIRSTASLGGNLCNASPAADAAPPLLVHGGRVCVAGPGGERQVPLEELLTGPGETSLAPGELVTAILLDPLAAGARSTFLKKVRVHVDIAVASVAVLLERDRASGRCTLARVAAGAVAPTPIRLAAVEAALEGSDLGTLAVTRAQRAASAAVQPISDLRAGADYRRHLVGVFVRRAVEALR